MDVWKKGAVIAPPDFLRAVDDAEPALLTPYQLLNSAPGPVAALLRPSSSSPVTAEAHGWMFGPGLTGAVHYGHQSEKKSHLRADGVPEGERRSSVNERLREEKDEMQGENERLQGKVQCLKELMREMESQIKRQSVDCDELHDELKKCRAELHRGQEQLSVLRNQHELERRSLEEALQDSKEESRELLQRLEDQNAMMNNRPEITLLRKQIQELISERDELKSDLRARDHELSKQSECLQNLRSYVGGNIAERKVEEQLRQKIQIAEQEKEALSQSVQLLNIRVNVASEILDIQEEVLKKEVQSDAFFSSGKTGKMLNVWRQKVFMLLVQLQTQDLQLQSEKNQLLDTVCALRHEADGLQSQNHILQRHLEDRSAHLDLQHVQTKEVQLKLDSTLRDNARLKEQNKSAERSMMEISQTAHRAMSVIEVKAGQMETVESSVSQLNHRLAFAVRRMDTVHGLLLRKKALWKAKQATRPPEPMENATESLIKSLQAEVKELSAEREKLTQELKRTPELIQAALSELHLQREQELDRLTEALELSRDELKASQTHHTTLQTQCEEHEKIVSELCSQVQTLQEQLDSAPQKVLEVESVCAEKIRDVEDKLSTARRGHTKAVVALRQVARQVEGERELSKEAERHTHRQLTRLQERLKDTHRDRNLLLAVLQEEGLTNKYHKLKASANQTSSKQRPERPSHSGHTESLLRTLQALSAEVLGSSEEDEEEKEGEASSLTQTPTCADT